MDIVSGFLAYLDEGKHRATVMGTFEEFLMLELPL